MYRFLISTPLAILCSLVLFYGLAVITSMGERRDKEVFLNPALDFLMVREESDLELRNRHISEPEEIIPQQQTQIPQLDPQLNVNVDSPMPSIDVPDISMEMDVSLSPSLHNLKVPDAQLGIDANPIALTRVPPRYPQRALQRRIEGKVVVEFIITELGMVKDGSVVVVESTPQGVFDKAVMRSIKRWRFKKRLVNGVAVPFRARQELEFKLGK